MRVAARPVVMGVPVLLAIALAAFLAMWAWGPVGISFTEKGTVNGIIEWTVYDSSGNVKAHDIIHNNVTNLGLDEIVTRLVEDDVTDADFDEIRLLSNATTGGAPNGSTDGTVNVTGGSPTVNTGVTINGDTTGNATVATTFSATGTAPIVEIHLTKTAIAQGAGMNYAAGDILAFQTVNITLESGDSVTFTWTIDIDP